jgi:hypothetical protein
LFSSRSRIRREFFLNICTKYYYLIFRLVAGAGPVSSSIMNTALNCRQCELKNLFTVLNRANLGSEPESSAPEPVRIYNTIAPPN